MTIFDFLTMLGSLSLFLFGMSVMGTALEKRAGGSLKAILAKLTSGRFSGLLTGLAVTAVIQSSSATTVMVVGFVNSGLLSLRQSRTSARRSRRGCCRCPASAATACFCSC